MSALTTNTPRADVLEMLHNVGLRPTRQRIALTSMLLRIEDRHVTAQIIYARALKARCPVSRATVTNALRQFERAGLLRRIPVRGSNKAWFRVDLAPPTRMSRAGDSCRLCSWVIP
jgi:Fur family iron response transcriptional regulator